MDTTSGDDKAVTTEGDAVITDRFVVNVSDSYVIPDEYQHRLLHLRDQLRAGAFEIGDITVELIGLSAMQGFDIPASRIYKAVGDFVGKAERTIRYYAETAGFFGKAVRDDYPNVPFSHFVFARSLGYRWKEVLEFADANPTVSEAGLRAWFTGKATDPDKAGAQGGAVPPGFQMLVTEDGEVIYQVTGAAMPPFDAVEEGDFPDLGVASIESGEVSPTIQASKDPSRNVAGLLSMLSGFTDSLSKLVFKLPLPPEVHAEVCDALATIKKRIPDIIEAFQKTPWKFPPS